MLKTILIVAAAGLLATPALRAQNRRVDFNGGHSFNHADYGHRGGGHNGGHYFYFGGVPYLFPFYDVGFGYPYYGYDYGFGYPGEAPDGAGPYGYPPYEGKMADQPGGGQNGPSLPTVVQQQLAKRGFYKGSVDGKFGPQSRSALSRFQHENGLQETGRIDEPTLMALGFSDHR